LEALRKDVLGEEGQIWIATHSIQIIAWAGANALYSVEGGVVSYAGNKVKQVIDSLSGGEQRREHLRDFLASADHFGFFHFVGQCLSSPGVVDASDRDDQEKVFARLVKGMCTPGHTLRVLDCGAGKGRLADAIARESTDLAALNYFLYDLDPKFTEHRSQALRRLRELGATGDLLDNLGSLRVENSRVHLVVLCNVLHEIPKDDWLRMFSSLKDVLLPEGRLIIIEDQEPAVGELPHEKGFLLLDKNELAELFGGDAGHVEDKSPGEGVANGRISVLCVPREHLESATQETLSRALKSLQRRANDEVDKLRRAGATGQRNGRRHALYVLLAFNAHRALS
jgi:SAM-dependent methyltransferase